MQRAVISKTGNIIGKFLENGGLCMPTIASGVVAIKVIWFAIRQRPFDLRIRVAAIAFYKHSVGACFSRAAFSRATFCRACQ